MAFAVCAVFVSSCSLVRVGVSVFFSFFSFGVSSVLLVSAGREVRCLTLLTRFARLRSSLRSLSGVGCGCGMVSSCFSFRFSSRVGVSFVVSALASRPSASCRRFVPSGRCLRLVSAGVSCRCCFVATFLSARFPVSSRLHSVAAVALFVFVPSGVSDGGVFVAVWVWRRSVVAAWRCGGVVWRGGVRVGVRGGVACRLAVR